jgi:hypothetical protein
MLNRIIKTGFVAALAISMTTACGEVESDGGVISIEAQDTALSVEALPQLELQQVSATRWLEVPTVAQIETAWVDAEPTAIEIEKLEEPDFNEVERIEVEPVIDESNGLESGDIASGCVSVDNWKVHAWATCTRIDAELIEINTKGECGAGDGATTATFVCQGADRLFSAFTGMVAGGPRSCKPYASYKTFAAATCGAERLVDMLPADPCYDDGQQTFYRAASFTCIH